MFKHTYETMNEKLEPTNELLNATLERMSDCREGRSGRRHVRAGRVFTVALSAALVLALSLTAVAAAVPSFREMLFGAGTSAAGSGGASGENSGSAGLTGIGTQLTEVENISTEYDGFLLEILGAVHDKESMVVYYTLTDTTGQNRLDRTTKVYPFTDIFERLQTTEAPLVDGVPDMENFPYSHYLTDVLDYNSETDTLLCRYVLDTENARDLDLSQVEFSIPVLTLGTSEIKCQPIALEESDFSSETMDLNGTKILKPGEMPLSFEGLGSSAVTAAGFVDGKLHIQFRTEAPESGYFEAGIQAIDKVISPEEVARAGGYTLDFERREAEAYYARTGTVNEYEGELIGHPTQKAQYFFNLENGVPVTVSGEDFFDRRFGYLEEVFDISPEELQYYNFYYSETSHEQELYYWNTEDDPTQPASDFRVEFSVSDETQRPGKSVESLTVEGGVIDSLKLTGLGITVKADRQLAENMEITTQVGGETVTYTKTIVSGLPYSPNIMTVDSYTGPVTVKYAADRPVDPETVTSLTVNSTEIPLE